MKNQLAENFHSIDELLGIESTMTLQDLILENEMLSRDDRNSFRAMVGK
jgi:hypothetical protein